MMIFSRFYSIRKSRQILKTSYKAYLRRGNQIPSHQRQVIESQLKALDTAILEGDREKADELARGLEEFSSTYFKKNFWDYALEILTALAVAFLIAIVIRQTWFELYEIPSGSMRPTFEEQDRLTVTKTAFGINIPLMTKHLYFDPSLVQRTSVIIWSGEGIAHLDSNSDFMGLFPYTKRYIKRCMGKPGDTLYFYGGKIYGIDQAGNDLVELRNNPWMEKLDNVPFINFEGRVSYVQDPTNRSSMAIFNLINQPLGRLTIAGGHIQGEILSEEGWIKDNPEIQNKDHSTIKTYSDFFGIRNFAIARLLTKRQAEASNSYDLDKMEEGILYLELRHTPNLVSPILGRSMSFLSSYSTLIPLQEKHLQALMNNMYTARFVIKNGQAGRYIEGGLPSFSSSSPQYPKVPDGTYEFYYGKAYKIGWGGIPTLLANDHPLYKLTPANIQKLFNSGIDITTHLAPKEISGLFFTNRYAYFREGDLYLLGAPIFKKTDPLLISFNEREKNKVNSAIKGQPYVAFRDYGPPLTEDGEIDKEFIKTFGYKVSEGHYLALGDNHAMSQDSRFFGPVPQANLQGAPSIIFWPPSDRWGFPEQKPYPLLTLPRLLVWGFFGGIALIAYLCYRRNLRKSVFKKNSTELFQS